MLLAQGAEGIAVGLATKILPHNFIELLDASIEVLKGNAPNLMVKAIAESRDVRMPSFFGYMLWSGLVMLPVLALMTVVFVWPLW